MRVWGLEQVTSYITALRASIARLETFPEIGAVHRLDAAGAIRRLVYRKHVIFYQGSGETIVIVRVLSVRAAFPDEAGLGEASDDS
jgi:plasmid stabilization system protein ParE